MNTFHTLILIGRPASGKSEIIDFLKHADPLERQRRFHLAELDVLDDFPMLWAWFEEDHLLSQKLGQPRLHTDPQGYFLYTYLWDLLVERLSLEYAKRLRDVPDHHQRFTTLIEFARGSEHGGYARAFTHLSDTVLQHSVVVYVNVPFEESLRKNRRRFNPQRPDSILEHALPDEKLERLYRDDDWPVFSASDPDFLIVRSLRVPYVVFENADDVTTGQPDKLAARLETTLERLWQVGR
jgi:hypothetical protein